MHTGFQRRNRRESDHLEDLGVDVNITLKQIFTKWNGGTDRINLVLDTDTWRVLVKLVRWGNLLTVELLQITLLHGVKVLKI
jgi:hypothetical protein